MALCDEIVENIMLHMPALRNLALASGVCRAWNELAKFVLLKRVKAYGGPISSSHDVIEAPNAWSAAARASASRHRATVRIINVRAASSTAVRSSIRRSCRREYKAGWMKYHPDVKRPGAASEG